MARIEWKITAKPGRVNVEEGRLRAFVADPGGPVVRDLQRRGDNIESVARATAPVDTGVMAATIRNQMDFVGGNPAVEVIVGMEGLTPYVGAVVHGAVPHVITPNTKKALRFIGNGGVVFAARVNHPGNAANRFMQEALLAGAQ